VGVSGGGCEGRMRSNKGLTLHSLLLFTHQQIVMEVLRLALSLVKHKDKTTNHNDPFSVFAMAAFEVSDS
jgi:hypothetical protein